MQKKEYSVLSAGKTMKATFSDLVDQASGSVILECADTIVLATACISRDGKNNPGFFNLTVEYQERNYAAGLILGGQYNKREGRPSDEAILTSRIIDRTIRPLFSPHIKNAVQVVVTILSTGEADPGVLGINAVSLALATSNIPWAGPVGAVLVTKPKGEGEISIGNYRPNTGETPYELDMTVCGKDGNVVMVEAMSFEYDEKTIANAFDMAMAEIKIIENWQKEIVKELGKTKTDFPKLIIREDLKNLFAEKIAKDVSILASKIFVSESKKAITTLENEWFDLLDEQEKNEIINSEEKSVAKDYLHHLVDEAVHNGALHSDKRVDGRALDEVRKLFAQAGGFSKTVHGSGIFYRGETHVMSFLTLGGPETAQEIDGMEVRGTKRFTHHYNFPPYSVGETGRFGGINRREMGHGFLAEKALIPVVPNKMDFPYTVRVVSECMASNGSTSQASICASSLALMDGGVPILRPVAGIAMGVMIDQNDESKYKIISDIQGPEDHHGDMDFKIAGTEKGITALQLDIKIGGIPLIILKEALDGAKKARLKILETIKNEIGSPRADISPSAPKIVVWKINPSQIGLIIGGGGKTVNKIREQTGAEITIEEDGTIYATGKGDAPVKAIEIIKGMTKEWNVGDSVEGEVVKILEVGAIVALSEFADGMVHISEIAPFRVSRVDELLKIGMKVPVKVVGVDRERDRISLSIKEANKDLFKPTTPTEKTEI